MYCNYHVKSMQCKHYCNINIMPYLPFFCMYTGDYSISLSGHRARRWPYCTLLQISQMWLGAWCTLLCCCHSQSRSLKRSPRGSWKLWPCDSSCFFMFFSLILHFLQSFAFSTSLFLGPFVLTSHFISITWSFTTEKRKHIVLCQQYDHL